MKKKEVSPTKILIVDHDEASFQIRQCVARALAGLPPLELIHAHDATEALAMLERFKPDVVVLDCEPEEKDLFMDSLSAIHPPLIVQSDDAPKSGLKISLDDPITKIPKCESLEGIHNSLVIAASIGAKYVSGKTAEQFH